MWAVTEDNQHFLQGKSQKLLFIKGKDCGKVFINKYWRMRMKVVVLAGGTSTERDVSLSSGTMIYRALKEKGHPKWMSLGFGV